jgi:hypothetical protein
METPVVCSVYEGHWPMLAMAMMTFLVGLILAFAWP